MSKLSKNHELNASGSELGKKSDYDPSYNPDKLYPIPRAGKRIEIGIDPTKLPFSGFDCWNHYEVSWLNEKGKPLIAIAEIIYDCSSPMLIESKSLKLYFNSFNNTSFKNIEALESTIKGDMEARVQAAVMVKIAPLISFKNIPLLASLTGENIDDLDIECSMYHVDPLFLNVGNDIVEETLCSDLLKSNCLITNQPDWGSIQIAYKGKKINRDGLLKYLISYRNHNEFHEQCIERIFMDIMQHCAPQTLTVYGRYTRRGGIDINPYRSTDKTHLEGKNTRLIRQ